MANFGSRNAACVRWYQNQTYNFEILRSLGESTCGGAETGEVLSAIDGVRAGDDEAWYQGWNRVAAMLEGRAETLSDPVSRGHALLRASNYYRTAEFFLRPADGRRLPTFDKSVQSFYSALDSLGIAYRIFYTPYASGRLKAVYFPGTPGAEKKPLIVAHGGYDSTLEELYFLIAAAALERGYAALIFTGPGQGEAIRRYGLQFTPEWEKPTGAVLDRFIAEFGKPAKIVLIGASMGGYLAPRAAAYDKRIDGVAAFDICYDFQEAALGKVPAPVRKLYDKGHTGIVDRLLGVAMKHSPGVRWGVHNAQWTMGAKSPSDLLHIFDQYNLKDDAARITCDVLIAAGEKDHHFPLRQVREFQAALTNARSVTTRIFTRREGGHEHCQMGAVAVFHETLFDWVESTFSGR
ncbi:MAG TPA: alpha/beta fold hydrolase [Candidatus Limiplasma sp.]|nr:alpha/beta fold hydrolase [Candidatus Limiplasma sp.]